MNLARVKDLLKKSVAITALNARQNSVLLTFDDGPDPEATPAILDLLDKSGALALFFVVGQRIDRAPHMLPEILRRGHMIGNHTYSHRASLGFSAQLLDCGRCQSEIERLTAYSPRALRPAEGRLDNATLWAAVRLRLKVVLWSVDSGDWKLKRADAARRKGREIAQELVSRPRLSEIILFHDDNFSTVAMLEELLPVLRQSGCRFAAPDEALPPRAEGRSCAPGYVKRELDRP